VGSNNLSTIFSGLIQDGGLSGGAGGSLTKVGSGMLVLTNANLYTGGTTIEGGKLVVNNRTGSGTGTGLVQVNGGTLGGKGTIAGPVILGTGSGPGAVLSPGKRGVKPAPLTIQSALTFNSDSTYNFGLKTNSANVVANGVTINGALFSFAALGVGALPAGTVFTVINNTATTPISGTFSNLPDGSTFTVGSNTFQTNYEGGDGNDLTLTVVP
jgi:autotransporter-associated beta strand protein